MKLGQDLFIITSLLPIAAHADSWLCIGDKVSMIAHTTEDGYTIEGVEDASDGFRWMVSDKGVKRFNSGVVEMEGCEVRELDITYCGSADSTSLFFILPTGTFQFTTLMPNESLEGLLHMMVVGTCSNID